ncbi:MAG: hypothetical protein ACK5MN_12595 [Lachnospiraceae bacterium]
METVVANITGITSSTEYPSGAIHECRVNEKNVISTPYGELIPQYTSPGYRKKELKTMEFYEDGSLRAIALEEQTDIKTPLGIMPAELLTFHKDGSLDSLFPLNGQIGFGWSLEEESALATPFSFEFSFTKFTAKINTVRFYPSGNVRSVVLWPGETIILHTPLGEFAGRIGFKLYENGALESFEPLFPVSLKTSIGDIPAYDSNALGVDADYNSICFDYDGRLSRLRMTGDLLVKQKNAVRVLYSSRTRPGLLTDSKVKLPIEITFVEHTVLINDGNKSAGYKIDENSFLIMPDMRVEANDCGQSCDSCAAGCV